MARPTGRCPLCLETRQLDESHFLPAGTYRLSRGQGLDNPNPFLISPNMCLQTSAQVKDYLLCHDCEQLFNRRGERWIMNNCYREQDGNFELRKCLQNVEPFLWGEDGGGFDTADVPGIDHGQIVYFALSMFWRAAVHVWQAGKDIIEPIDLGPYQENIRRFLRDEEALSPHIFLSVWLSNSEAPLVGSTVPTSWRVESGGIMHRMYIPGIAFLLTIGKNVDDSTKKTCFMHVPGRPVFMSGHLDAHLYSILRARMKRTLE
jgi:hypothetical protein